jgi:hypothetical protein
MNADEIQKMPAGSVMDALIAEKIMDLIVTQDRQATYSKMPNGYKDLKYLTAYSVGIAEAWEVVKKMRERGMLCDMESGRYEGWYVHFGKLEEDYSGEATGIEAPLAICRAALLAVME